MKVSCNRLFVVGFFFLALMSPALMAVQMTDEKGATVGSGKNVERFLHGEFISLKGTQLKTSLGGYILTDIVKVIDERKPVANSKGKVQLTIRNNILIQVVIYD